MLTGSPYQESDLCIGTTVVNNFDSTYTVKWTPTIAEKYQVKIVNSQLSIKYAPDNDYRAEF